MAYDLPDGFEFVEDGSPPQTAAPVAPMRANVSSVTKAKAPEVPEGFELLPDQPAVAPPLPPRRPGGLDLPANPPLPPPRPWGMASAPDAPLDTAPATDPSAPAQPGVLSSFLDAAKGIVPTAVSDFASSALKSTPFGADPTPAIEDPNAPQAPGPQANPNSLIDRQALGQLGKQFEENTKGLDIPGAQKTVQTYNSALEQRNAAVTQINSDFQKVTSGLTNQTQAEVDAYNAAANAAKARIDRVNGAFQDATGKLDLDGAKKTFDTVQQHHDTYKAGVADLAQKAIALSQQPTDLTGTGPQGPLEHIGSAAAQGYEQGQMIPMTPEMEKKYPNLYQWMRTPAGVINTASGGLMAAFRAGPAVASEAAQALGMSRGRAADVESGLNSAVDFEMTGQKPHAPEPGAFLDHSPNKPRPPAPENFDLGAVHDMQSGPAPKTREERMAEQAAAGRAGYEFEDKQGNTQTATPTDPDIQQGLKGAPANYAKMQEDAARSAAQNEADAAARKKAADQEVADKARDDGVLRKAGLSKDDIAKLTPEERADRLRQAADAKAAAEGQPAPSVDDTGQNMPETPETLKAQQEQLVAGTRKAQMFPKGTEELPLPKGMERVETDRGVFHYDPAKISADQIKAASAAGRENDILDLGPASKADVDASAAAGNPRVNVTERGPNGEEVKTATGTTETAPAQAAHMEDTKTPGNTVQAEPLDKTVAERENGLLRGMGWSDADIAKMPPEQRADQVREAMDAGVEPVAGKPSAPTPADTPATPASAVTSGKDAHGNEVVNFGSLSIQIHGSGFGGGQHIFVKHNGKEYSFDKQRDGRKGGYQPSDLPDTTIPAPLHPIIADFVNGKITRAEMVERLKGVEKTVNEAKKPGTREAPIKATEPEHIDQAAAVAKEPTPAQAEAGNYQKGHIVHTELGRDVAIETPKGAVRRSKPGQPKWENVSPAHYGYIKGTKGADGEPLDIYLGSKRANGKTFVVDQQDPKTGKFDEHKIIHGVDSVEEAARIYHDGFSDGSGHARMGAITETSVDHLNDWIDNGDKTKAFAEPEAAAPERPNLFAKDTDPTFLKNMSTADREAFEKGDAGKKDVAIKIGHAIDNLRAQDPNHPRAANLEGKLKGVLDSILPNRDTSRRPSGMPPGYERPASGKWQKEWEAQQAEARRQAQEYDEAQRKRREEDERNDKAFKEAAAAERAEREKESPAYADELAQHHFKEGTNPDTILRGRGHNETFVQDVNRRVADLTVRKHVEDMSKEAMADPRGPQAWIDKARKNKVWHLSDIEKEIARLQAEKAAAEPKPKKGEKREIGQNRDGETVYEDHNGVRSVVRDGVRISEAVHVVPGKGFGVTPETRGPEHKLTTEMGEEPAARPHTWDATVADIEKYSSGNFHKIAREKAVLKTWVTQLSDADWHKLANWGLYDFPRVLGDTMEPARLLDAFQRSLKADEPVHINKEETEPGIIDRVAAELTGAKKKPGPVADMISRARKGEPLTDTERAFLNENALASGSREAWKTGKGLNVTDKGRRLLDKAGDELDQHDADWAHFQEAADAALPTEPAAGATPSPFDPKRSLPDAFADHFFRGRGFQTILQARKFAKEAGHDLTPKEVEEALEHGVVKTAREIVRTAPDSADAYRQLVALYERQPTLGSRTGKSIELQAYSTPAPLAYVAGRLAGIDKTKRVLEPTAGNGMLVMDADPKKTTVNELDPERAAALHDQGFKPTTEDASLMKVAPKTYDSVIANPPFGTVKRLDGGNKRWDMKDIQPGYVTGEVDHAIALRALEGMKDDGKAVLIIGGLNKLLTTPEARSDGYNGKAKREFFLTLYKNYNVVDHFTVPGELYAKQGAGWPVDVIVIHGRGKSARALPAVDVPPILGSWDELKGKLDGAGAAETGRPSEGRDSGLSGTATGPSEPVGAEARGAERGAAADAGGRAAEGDRPGRQPEGADGRADAGQPEVPVADPAAETVSRPGAERGEPERSGAEAPAGEYGLADEPPAEAPKAKKPKKQEQETEGQVAYTPHSRRAQGLGTLVPKNMKTATEDALKRVAEKRGDTDKFVADALGMKIGEISKYFSAEQADALALALDNFEKGAGFIIGDQTGIGKGRIVAGVIRYALNKGLTPIFVTEKPNLYGDMWRDMGDVGITEHLGREPRIFMTNTDDVPLGGGAALKGSTGPKRNAELQQIARTGELPDHDMIFTTYNQMQTVKEAETARHGALRAMAPKSVLILDEAHNAGGTASGEGRFEKEGGPPTRAEFVRELVGAAQSVFYSSATYAKRPDVMDLYSKTDMGKAVGGESLAETIKNGGVPMQQVVAAMLSRAGQYMRRERSFAGVQYDVRVSPVDKKVYANLSKSLAAINDFSRAVKAASKGIKEEIKATAKSMGMDAAVGDAGASSTNFTSIMHNVIAQAVLAMKADGAADRAIEKIRAGEKPVITVANTMGSFISQVAEEMGLNNGDAMPVTFGKLLDRYLERTRTITIKEPYSKTPAEKIYLTDEQLGPAGVQAYKDAKAVLKKADFSSLPVSPIDHIIQKIKDAGYSVGEITGRSATLDYSNPQETRYKVRQQKEISIAGRRAVIDGFNDGTLDAVILNRAGSTGLSLHASSAFKDQRKRHMILAQPEENIDTHMQMLGRIHRTGQVVLPSYDQLVADIPAEKRPAAVLAKKMASLNAATTASRKGALSSDAVADIMNEYGDQVAYDVMRENPDTHKLLDEPLNLDDEEPKEGSMRKVTGRVPLLDIPDQERIYAHLESAYHDLVAQKEADGESVLEAKLLDLDARLLESQVLVNGDGESPFTEPVVLETHDVKRQTKPYTGDDFARQLAEANMKEGEVAPVRDEAAMKPLLAEWTERQKKTQLEARNEFTAFRRRQVQDIEKESTRDGMNARFDQNETAFKQLMDTLVPGRSISILNPETGERQSGVVLSMERHGDTQNPIALGSWRIKFAQPGAGVRTVPLSQLYAGYGEPPVKTMKPVEARYETAAKAADAFDEQAKDTREKRVIVTGNILSGFAAVKGRGQITNFVDSEGNIRQGILLKANIKSAADLAATIGKPLKSAAEIQNYLKELGPEVSMRSKDGAVTLMRLRNDDLAVTVPKSKKDGGKYYLDQGVKSALAGPDRWSSKDFSSRGNLMRVDVFGNMEARLLDALVKAGANFETKPKATANEKVKTHTRAETMQRRVEQHVDALDREVAPNNLADRFRNHVDDLAHQVAEIVGRVGGNHVNGLRLEGGKFWVNDAYGRRTLAGGTYSSFIRLVRVALDGDRDTVRSRAHHEAFHALEEGGALTPQETALLERETPAMRERVGKAYTIPPEELANLPEKEVRAHAYEDWAHNADQAGGDARNLHVGIRRIFQKVRELVERIRNFLRGRGYQSLHDVFKKVYEGDVGRREARGEGSGGDAFQMMKEYGVEDRFRSDPKDYPAGYSRTPQGERRYFRDETTREKIRRKANALRREAGTYVKEQFQDYSQRMLDFQRASEDAAGAPLNQTKRFYDQKRLLQGKTKAQMDEFNEAHLTPLLKAIKEYGLTRQDVAEYVFAKHAPERNALMDQRDPANMGKGSGIDDTEAQAILARLQRDGHLAALDQHIAPIVQGIRDFNLDHAVRGGILTKSAATEWRNQMPTYVPLTGFEDANLMPDEHYFREGRKMGVFGKESETAFGRGSISDDPLAGLVRQSYRTIDRVERNRVGMTLWRNLRALSDQDRKDLGVKLDEGDSKKVIDPQTGLMKWVDKSPLAEPERVVSLKIGGLPHHVIFDDARTARAVNRMGSDQLPVILKQAKAIVDLAKGMWTHYNPDFVVRHFGMRYPIEAIMNAGEHGPGAMGRAVKGFPLAKPMRSIMKAMKLDPAGRAALLQKFNSGQATEGERYQHYFLEARKAGAVMDFSALSDLDSLKRYMDQSVASISKQGQTLDAARGQARAVHKAWNNVLQAMDNAHRLVAYIEARDRGEDVTKAALAARDATVDFGMRGALANWINLWWPFGNTAIQTSARLESAAFRGGKLGGKFAAYAIGGSFAAGFLASVFNYMFGGQDANGTPYQELLPEYVRRLNMSIILPGTKDRNGEPHALTIALPYNYAMPYTLGQAAAWGFMKAAGYATESAGKIAKMVMHSVLEGTVGMPQEDSLLGKATPGLALPFLHVAMNKTFFGSPLHTDFPKQGIAHSWQGRPTTGEGWKMFSQGLNAASGGDHRHAGALDLYPEDAREIFGFFTSAFSRFGTKAFSGSAGDIASGKMPVPEETPFLDTMMKGSKTYDQVRQSNYYEMRDDLRDKAKAYADAVKEGDTADAQRLMAANGKEIAAHDQLKGFETQLRKINAARTALRRNAATSDADRERIGKELDEQTRIVQNQASKVLGRFIQD